MKDDLFNFDESLADGFGTAQPKNDYNEKLKKARILCIRGRFQQALEIVEAILDEDMENMGAYVELLRVHTEDFTIYEGSEIDKDIHAIEKLFPDIDNEEYIDYLQKRRKALKGNPKPQVQEDTDTNTPATSTESTAKTSTETKRQTSSTKAKKTSTNTAAGMDEALVLYAYGLLYMDDKKDTYDPDKALENLKKAADLGHEEALKTYVDFSAKLAANRKSFDTVVTKPTASIMSEDEAEKIVENQAGYSASKIQEAKDALEMYAQKGSANALFNIGYYYSNGKHGYTQNKTKAFEYYKKAADLGKRNAMYNVGLFYANGSGVRKNATKSFEYYKMAADNGDSDAMLKIGICYKDGIGVVISTQKAIEYLKKAVQNGNNNAKDLLNSLENPPLTEIKALDIIKNSSKYTATQVQEAKKAYEEYAKKGSSSALCNIGLYYSTGRYGYTQNKMTAQDYYTRAAAAGSKEAMYNLGIYYQHGTAGVKDPKKSFEYYKKSADLGDVDAMYETGRCYRDGSGVLKSTTQAVAYFKKAASNGNQNAKDALKRMGY